MTDECAQINARRGEPATFKRDFLKTRVVIFLRNFRVRSIFHEESNGAKFRIELDRIRYHFTDLSFQKAATPWKRVFLHSKHHLSDSAWSIYTRKLFG